MTFLNSGNLYSPRKINRGGKNAKNSRTFLVEKVGPKGLNYLATRTFEILSNTEFTSVFLKGNSGVFQGYFTLRTCDIYTLYVWYKQK